MKRIPIIAVICVFLSQILFSAPRLVVSTPSLAPESTVDLVFDRAVIPVADVGKTTANHWLRIQPGWEGKLKWKAANIAAFLPEHAPTIGAKYEFSVPEGREHLDGTEIKGGRIRILASEAFRVASVVSPRRWSSGYSVSTAAWYWYLMMRSIPRRHRGFSSLWQRTASG